MDDFEAIRDGIIERCRRLNDDAGIRSEVHYFPSRVTAEKRAECAAAEKRTTEDLAMVADLVAEGLKAHFSAMIGWADHALSQENRTKSYRDGWAKIRDAWAGGRAEPEAPTYSFSWLVVRSLDDVR